MMRKAILATVAVALLMLLAMRPAKPADFNGKMLDGHPFFASLSSGQTTEYGIVVFHFDEARIRLNDGRTFTVVLNDESIGDIHFIGGHTLDKRFWRIDLQESSYLYRPNGY